MRTYCYWVAGNSYAELAAFSIATVKKSDPDASVLVVGREESWNDWWGDTSALISIEPGPLMVENLRAQIAAMHHCQRASEFVFLDVDTVMLKPFPEFKGDVAVTWRKTIRDKAGNLADASSMPYNYGVLGVKRNRAGFAALYWMLSRVTQMHERHQEWYGNQLALLQLAGPLPAEPSIDKLHERHPFRTKTTVQMFPCDTWNYTPYDTNERVSDKGILHFKGSQKEAMRDFA